MVDAGGVVVCLLLSVAVCTTQQREYEERVGKKGSRRDVIFRTRPGWTRLLALWPAVVGVVVDSWLLIVGGCRRLAEVV